MKVIIFGAAGIIGQHMRLCVPAGVEPIWVRSNPDKLHYGVDLTDPKLRHEFLEDQRPDVIVNLAGESRPDDVERDPDRYAEINTLLPGDLARWCERRDAHYVHVSTQAVFGGQNSPYSADSQHNPANTYGQQKSEAEYLVRSTAGRWTIVRPTFVLGVTPMPAMGRPNPVETILSGAEKRSVDNRWFSVSFAEDVAREMWAIATGEPRYGVVQIGSGRFTRHDIATALKANVTKCLHEDFYGIARRPADTTYAAAHDPSKFEESLRRCVQVFRSREELGIEQRARELSIFTGLDEASCLQRLRLGFGALHKAVTEDFRRVNPKNDDELLAWYRSTDAYIWELSAYHRDPGFNYSGMCRGISESLKARGARRVLCLGDGIGDLTIALAREGFEAVYHDLENSRTAAFARMRFLMYTGQEMRHCCTDGWAPNLVNDCDAVVSLDFLEHVTDVPAWTAAIQRALKPGGWFVAQNAFACGSGPDGSIPMHLSCNDRFEKDWDPMLASIGFTQIASNWYQRAA